MGQEINIYRGATGLNMRVDPVRQRFNPETGMTDLSEAVNVRIDPTGRISRIKGYSQLTAGSFKSLCPFDCGGYTLVMSGTSLYAIDAAGVTLGVRSGMTDAYVDYEMASDGEKNYVYYLNGYERGRVYDRVSYVWEALDYSGPDTTREFDDPPNGHLLTLYNGRMYIAQDNIVYASEPHDFGKFNLAESYLVFPGEITFLDDVDDGIFVSDIYSTYFLSGQDIALSPSHESFSLRKLSNKSVIRGSGVRTSAENLGMDVSGDILIAWTDFGCHVLGPGGYFKNHTINKLIRRTPASGNNYLPDSTHGASIIINNEQLISTFT